MKRQVSNSGVAFMLSLLFMLGGLFIANDVQAQANNLMQTQQPVTNWISPQQALAVASIEVENLTAKVQQMKNNGAEKSALNKVKAELRLYTLVLKALQNGMGTEESFKLAWASFGGSATGVNTPYSIQEAEALYNKALDKLTD
jgi:hypothetical protein